MRATRPFETELNLLELRQRPCRAFTRRLLHRSGRALMQGALVPFVNAPVLSLPERLGSAGVFFVGEQFRARQQAGGPALSSHPSTVGDAAISFNQVKTV